MAKEYRFVVDLDERGLYAAHVESTSLTGNIWQLPKPNQHRDLVKWMMNEGLLMEEIMSGTHGFMSEDEFMNRKQAYRHACYCRQISPDVGWADWHEHRELES